MKEEKDKNIEDDKEHGGSDNRDDPDEKETDEAEKNSFEDEHPQKAEINQSKSSKFKFASFLKIGLLFVFAGFFSWILYSAQTINKNNLKISDSIEKTLLQINQIQTEQIKIKKDITSLRNTFNNKFKALNSNDDFQNFSATASELKNKVSVLQKDFKILESETKKNQNLVASLQTQRDDISSQKEQVSGQANTEEIVVREKNGIREASATIKSVALETTEKKPPIINKITVTEENSKNKVILFIEDRVELIFKKIAVVFSRLKEKLLKTG